MMMTKIGYIEIKKDVHVAKYEVRVTKLQNRTFLIPQ